MHSIKLSDGTELKNLTLNGNNFISDVIVSDDIFKNNLGKVSIFNEGAETIYEDMKLIQNIVAGGKSWFILAEKTKEEIEKEALYQLLADLTETVLLGGV